MRHRLPLVGVAFVAIACLGTAMSDGRAAETKDSEPTQVSFYKDIRPIFQAQCHGCHQPAKPSGSYVMTTFASLLKGGESEDAAVIADKPDESNLIELITPEEGEAEMPKGKKPLSATEIEKITQWIAQGAVDDTPASAAARYDQDHPPTYAAPPIISSLDFSPDGTLLAVSGFHEVLLHRADGSGLEGRLVGLSERIESVVFSPDGKRLAVTGGRPARMGEVQIWDVEKRELTLSVPATFDTVYGASWSPDGKYVAFGCADNSVRAIDAATGEQVLLQRASSDWTLDTTFSIDGSHVVSVGRDMAVKLTEFKTERFVDNITSITPGALKGGLMAVARRPDRDEVLVGGDDGRLRSYRMYRTTARKIGDDSNLIREFAPMPGRIFDATYSQDGERVAAGSSHNRTGAVYAFHSQYELEIPEKIKKIESKTVSDRSPEERDELSKFHDGGVTLIAKMAGQKGPVYAVAFRHDGLVLASAGFDGTVRLNNPESGELIKEFIPVPLEIPAKLDDPSEEVVQAGQVDPS